MTQSRRKVLIANRGEIAVRLQRSAALFPRPGAQDVIFDCLSIYTDAEEHAAHVLAAPLDRRIRLDKAGPRAYLDVEAIIEAAKKHGAWAIAPGYGFLSESAHLAKRAEQNGIVWIGPTADQLALLSDKVAAKRLAQSCGVPTLQCTKGDWADGQEVRNFFEAVKADVIIKAVSGGGGRGMRIVRADEGGSVAEAYNACSREAQASFGDGRVYAERYLADARHIEVQIIGDGTGDVAHAWERECSIQRRHQKMIEIAPSPSLVGQEKLRMAVIQAAVRMAERVKIRSLATFEFLVLPNTGEYFFMEVNPRIQVEHTVTEQITGIDLIAVQLQLATGAKLQDLGLGRKAQPLPAPRHTSIQCRVNSERFSAQGDVIPTSGTINQLNLPSGPGIRIDTAAHAPLPDGTRYQQTALFDSLLLKAIFTAPTYELAVQMADNGLGVLGLDGLETNIAFLRALLQHEAIRQNQGIHTRFVEQHFAVIFAASESLKSMQQSKLSGSANTSSVQDSSPAMEAPSGTEALLSPLSGLLTGLTVHEGDSVQAGQQIALLESMKMEHVVRADKDGTVRKVAASKGSTVNEGEAIVFIEVKTGQGSSQDKVAAEEDEENVDTPRPDLQQILDRRRLYADEIRIDAVAKRRASGFLTARQNIALLADADTFIEWGDLQFAAQRTRMDEEELRSRTSNDGVITGWATVNGRGVNGGVDDAVLVASNARCALCIYDYMVLAGTQGHFHHLKLDRLFRSVLENPAPLILYAEGGGGRPGDVDLVNMKVAGLDTPSFALMAAIRARGYPSIGVANGYTFAGNAALLGTCDIVVATEGGAMDAAKRGSTSTGMGGPAMIEGGGLGRVKPEEVGPVRIHSDNGDYDVVVPTELEAASTVKKLVSFFQGPSRSSAYTQDERQLRRLLPKQRTRAYDVRRVITALVDDDTFIELGRGWGHSIVTGLARIQGQTIGILASAVLSPLGGAIDAPSAQKASRLITMLHRTRAGHLMVLCDTPGFMVGPPAEKQGGLRIFAEFFANMMAFQDGSDGGRVFAVTLRKAYGLGAQAMLGGSSLANFYSVAWPQGEFAGMGIEGAVRLGMRKELEAAKEGKEREELFTSLVDMMYERGKAHNMAALAEIDTVIDPAETRKWLVNGLRFTRARTPTWQAERRSHSSNL